MHDLGKWLSDNANWLIGTVVGAIGVVVALLVYFWQRKPKTLDYRVAIIVPLLAEHAKRIRQDFKVLYRDEELAEPHIVYIRVRNTGKVPVLNSDYKTNIKVVYEKGGPLLDAFVSSASTSKPEDMECDIWFTPEERSVEVRPEVLNAGEWLELQIVSDGDPGGIDVTSRFIGQSRQMKDKDPPPKFAFAVLFFGISLMLVTLVVSFFDRYLAGVVLYSSMGVSLIGMALLFLGIFRGQRF